MSFDRDGLIAACRAHRVVARIVVARVRGSAPREVGAAMLVWAEGFSGTIGGGALEHRAMMAARQDLVPGHRQLTRHALGPDLGQCCGGSVDLLTEVYDTATVEALPRDLVLRGPGEMPLAVARLRASGERAAPRLVGDWMVEPVSAPEREIWIWGAGHVGRALVSVLHPLPDLRLTWIDVDRNRFPDAVPEAVNLVTARRPEALARHAAPGAEHLVVTYSHDLDLGLCHALLSHRFAFAGLIGSATKWARFRSRLAALGHRPEAIARITCPIGDKAFGKHPQAIALGVAAGLLESAAARTRLEDSA